MNKNIYSPDQIQILLNNKNIKNCTGKSITYTQQFKVRAVQEYYQDGLSPNMIFRKAGLNLSVIGRMQPKECLKRWATLCVARQNFSGNELSFLLAHILGRFRIPRMDS